MTPSKLERDRLLMIRGLEDLVKSMKHCVETSEAYLTTYRDAFSSNEQEEDVKPVKGKRKDSDVEEPVVGGKRKRIVKAKDPNAPRRPGSTYLLFQNDMRAITKQDHPNIPYQELTSLMSKMWSELSAEEKQTYVDQHDTLIKKYEEDMAAYKALAKGDDEDEEGSATAKSKAVRTPKEKASDPKEKAAEKVKEKAKKDEKAEKAKEKQEKERETEKEKEKGREQEKAKPKPRKSNAPITPATVDSDTSEESQVRVVSSSSSSDSSEDESTPEPVTKKAKISTPASTATKKRKA